jgi:nucleoside-diphosphate-sugar epimerase
MRILFIGGTGTISSACSALALERGFDVYLLNRGKSERPVPSGARSLRADINDRASVASALGDLRFDSVVNWVAYHPEQVAADIETFVDRTDQYVFISSASAYQKPVGQLPITESTPLSNPYWEYSRNKIACEDRLVAAYRDTGFPVTIVRPSHTYDRTRLPVYGRYTIVDRMRRGRKIVVPGDGTSLWVLTHHLDFAKGFTGLLGNPHSIGESFHITSDEVLTWDQIYRIIARAAGAPPPDIVHVPSEAIARFDPIWGESLLGDKMHSVIFDNTKIKRLVPDFVASIPYATGVREVVNWFDADPSRQVVEDRINDTIDELVAQWTGAFGATDTAGVGMTA